MLPGFRFLFGAIVLCFSILVFGLGAAALLRAAHEQFASRPSWYPTPSTTFAQQSVPFAQQGDSSGAVLALLELDPDDNDAARETPRDIAQEPGLPPSATEPTAAVTDPAVANFPDTRKPAALSAPEQPPPTATYETASSVPPTPEPDKLAHAETDTAPGQASAAVERPAPVAASEPETRTASADAITSVAPSTAASEPIMVPAAGPEPSAPEIVAPQIAALGGSTEATDAQAREKEASRATRARVHRNLINKRLRAERAAEARRRLAHRTRIVRRAAVQQQPRGLTTVPATAPVQATETPYRF